MLTCPSTIKFIVHLEEPSFDMKVFRYQFSQTLVELEQKRERESVLIIHNCWFSPQSQWQTFTFPSSHLNSSFLATTTSLFIYRKRWYLSMKKVRTLYTCKEMKLKIILRVPPLCKKQRCNTAWKQALLYACCTYLWETVDVKVAWRDFNFRAEKNPLGTWLGRVQCGYFWLWTQHWDI